MRKKSPSPQKTITFGELSRLSFCNSDKLPRVIEINGELREWVGIGWIPVTECRTQDIVKVVE
jgi:hypothetical protein